MSRVFFTDRDLGKRFAEILRAAGLAGERDRQNFSHDSPGRGGGEGGRERG